MNLLTSAGKRGELCRGIRRGSCGRSNVGLGGVWPVSAALAVRGTPALASLLAVTPRPQNRLFRLLPALVAVWPLFSLRDEKQVLPAFCL